MAVTETVPRSKRQGKSARQAPPPPMAPLYTEAQAAEFLQKSTNTLNRWRMLRIGPAYLRIGGHSIRYSLDDLVRFATAEKVSPHTDGQAESVRSD